MSDSLLNQLEARMAARAEMSPPPQDEQDPEAQDDTEGVPEGEEGAPEPEEAPEQPEEIQSLLDFGKAAGWEPEELYSLKLKLDTGEELTLGSVKDRLQTYAREHTAVEEQTQRLREYEQQLQAQAQQYFDQRQTEGAEAQSAREAMLQVEARYNSVDWDKLAQSDPGRAAFLQQQLAVDYAGAKQAHAQAQAKEQQAQAQLYEQTRAQHAQALLQMVPEWRDQAKVQEEYPALQRYLVQQGFRGNEIESIYDARAITIARKAMLYDQGQIKMKETQEKVKAAPKPVVRPGGGVLRGAAEQAHTTALVKKARESGNRNDKTAAAAAVLAKAFGAKR